MENVKEFQTWLHQCIDDSKEKLDMTDATLADILLREGLYHYHRHILKEHISG